MYITKVTVVVVELAVVAAVEVEAQLYSWESYHDQVLVGVLLVSLAGNAVYLMVDLQMVVYLEDHLDSDWFVV